MKTRENESIRRAAFQYFPIEGQLVSRVGSVIWNFGPPIVLIVLSGCRAPWGARNDVPKIESSRATARIVDDTTDAAHLAASDSQINMPSKSDASLALPRPEPTQEEAMAAVLADLEEIGAIDPVAREALMADLREAKLSNWPLIVQSFRAALAYRQQLLEREQGGEMLAANPTDASLASDNARIAAHPDASSAAPRSTADGASPQEERSREVDSETPDAVAAPLSEPFRETPPRPDADNPAPSRNDNPLRAGAQQSSSAVAAIAPADAREASPIPVHINAGITGPDESAPQRILAASYADEAVHDGAARTTAQVVERDPFEMASQGERGAEEPSDPMSASWEERLDATISKLEAETGNAPTTPEEERKHAMLRMMYIVANRRDDALRPIEGIAPARQDYWSKQLFALSTYLDADGQPDERRRAAAAQSQLAAATHVLGELGGVTVRNLAFCRDISGFGAFTPYSQPSFTPGQRVLVYAEVENYRSVSTEKGFRTLLLTRYHVVDAEGVRVGGGDFPEVEDFCSSRRRDFHIQYGVVLPRELGPGKHTIEFEIEDVLSQRVGRSTANFEVSAASIATNRR